MNIEELISQYLDGTLNSEAEAELHHRLSVSPEARRTFKAQIALQGIARDSRVLHSPTLQMRNALFDRLQREEGMGPIAADAAKQEFEAAPPAVPVLREPEITFGMEQGIAYAKPRFAPPDKPAVRSRLATKLATTLGRNPAGPEHDRRRRRLAAILLPLLVLVIASGIIWKSGGVGSGNDAKPNIAANDAAQTMDSAGTAGQPQSASQTLNDAATAQSAKSSITETIGEELLAANAPTTVSSPSEIGYRRTLSGSGQAEPHDASPTNFGGSMAAITSVDEPERSDEGIGEIAASSAAEESTEGSELGRGIVASFDDVGSDRTLLLDGRGGTMMLDGKGDVHYLRADSMQHPARDLFAEGDEGGTDADNPDSPDSPLAFGGGSVRSTLSHSSDGLSLMGPQPTTFTMTTSGATSASDSSGGDGAGSIAAVIAPPPPPIHADLQGRNPRGAKIAPPSEDVSAESQVQKSSDGGSADESEVAKSPQPTMRKDPRTRSASEQLQAEGKSASISTADILSLNNNRLTFTESATQRLLASNVAIQNAKLELSLDTSLTISGTLVQHGEQTRRSKESELPYQVVAGTMVIDVSALPADQLQKLQAYLRAVGKSE